MRLAVLTSHPIQYYAPLFRHLAELVDLHVFFAHDPTPSQQGAAGFGTTFAWDIDLRSGYSNSFLHNRAKAPSVDRFSGCDTPEIFERLREGRFDALLSFGWYLKFMLQGIWAAKRLGIPVLVRGDSQLSTPRSAAKRLAKSIAYPPFLSLFDAGLFVGERNRQYYEFYGYPRSRLFRSPHCVDTKRFAEAAKGEARHRLREELGVKPKSHLVLFAGKLIAIKRPLDVIEAVACLRGQGANAEVVIAGSGPLEEAVRERAKETSVLLHVLGFQNQTRMPSVYAGADALVLSSSQETWGLVCNEALACGTPIVVSDAVGCAPDLASDGRVGRSYPTGDAVACGNALAKLLASPPSHDEIASVSEHYSVQHAARGIVEALEATIRPAVKATQRSRPHGLHRGF